MANEAKTKSAALDREAFLAGVESPERRAEALRLLDLFGRATGWEPRLWGPSIVGFGRYDYLYDSGHRGTSLATGFSPRRAELSVYILPGYTDFGPILSRLGPHRVGKSCLYLKRLDKVDEAVLEELIRAGLADLAKLWPVHAV
ncbi:Domain of unknown function DUF1801 [Paracoccaceae bacterium]|jgi:hypothetical protein